jgi:hypothetical protein
MICGKATSHAGNGSALKKKKSGADPKTRMTTIHCAHKTTSENIDFLIITNARICLLFARNNLRL